MASDHAPQLALGDSFPVLDLFLDRLFHHPTDAIVVPPADWPPEWLSLDPLAGELAAAARRVPAFDHVAQVVVVVLLKCGPLELFLRLR